MLNLMNQCDIVEKQNMKRNERRNAKPSNDDGDDTSKAFQFKNNPFSVFSGIIPGTKWCGTGDIAATYSDLGKQIRHYTLYIVYLHKRKIHAEINERANQKSINANNKK